LRLITMFPFALTIFISAFLLFQIQPLISRYILPWFGGSPAVWSASMLFFQVLLLGGYGYAHWLTTRARRGPGGHILLLLGSLLAILLGAVLWGAPLLPDAALRPPDPSAPLLRILLVLLASVGLPYFVLSSTSPLLQAWWERRFPGQRPYRLYALSNLGSLLALATYPFIFEPLLSLRQQSALWSFAYLVFAALCGFLAYRTSRLAGDRNAPLAPPEPDEISGSNWEISQGGLRPPLQNRIGGRGARFAPKVRPLMPLQNRVGGRGARFAPKVRSLMPLQNRVGGRGARFAPKVRSLMPLQNRVGGRGTRFAPTSLQEPFPTGIDLNDPSRFNRLVWVGLAACTSILLLSVTNQLSQEVAVIPFLWVLPLSLYLLSFVVAFSGESWYRRGPYLAALGLATLLVAYSLYHVESMGILLQIGIYSLFLFLACLVCHAELYRRRPEESRLTAFYFLVSLGGALGGLFVNLAAPLLFQGYWELQVGALVCWAFIFLLLAADRTSFFYRRAGWVVVAAFVLFFGLLGVVFYQKISTTQNNALTMNRNFYGVFRVRSISVGDPAREAVTLTHGITSHGFQLLEDRAQPTSYYGPQSGIGLAINNYRKILNGPGGQPGSLRIGVVGLGIGTIAVYGEEGDTIRFYEIDPDVIALAQGEGDFFTYLQDTPAEVEIVPGDARLSLEAELERGEAQGFHILAVDAFNGDSIPVHLLTAEAISLYLEHLAPQGVLALHISNRYLDLTPVVKEAAEMYNLGQALVYGPRDDRGSYPSKWVLLSTDRSFLARPEIAESNLGLGRKPGFRLWTDDYSNLFQVLYFADPLWAIPATIRSQ
jgi:hypothetical protein